MAERLEAPVGGRPPIDPNVGIPDLVSRLRDDAKRLVGDEIRLAKLEMHETLDTGARGLMWLAIALGVSAVMLVAWTLFVATVVAQLAGHAWIGALAAGLIDIAMASLLISQGVRAVQRWRTPP